VAKVEDGDGLQNCLEGVSLMLSRLLGETMETLDTLIELQGSEAVSPSALLDRFLRFAFRARRVLWFCCGLVHDWMRGRWI